MAVQNYQRPWLFHPSPGPKRYAVWGLPQLAPWQLVAENDISTICEVPNPKQLQMLQMLLKVYQE